MERRRFLASAGAATAVGLAGCAGLSGETEAASTFVQDGADRYFSFHVDGTEVATAGVRLYEGTSGSGPLSFQVWAEQERDTTFTDFRLELGHENPNGALYMEPPSGRPWPAFEYTHAEGHPGTVVDASDLGAQASGTLTFGFLFDPWDEEPRLDFDVSFGLTTGGLLASTWRCSASRNLDLPPEI